jgi:CubicO group peptidase (beta-lactamase class C family)
VCLSCCCSVVFWFGLLLATASQGAAGADASSSAATGMLRGAAAAVAAVPPAGRDASDAPILVNTTSTSTMDGREDRSLATALSTALSTALATAVRKTATPGATAALYRCGTLLWSGEAGVKDVVSRAPTSAADTLFVLASSTKSYVASLVMSLVESGALTLGTLLSTFYPGVCVCSQRLARAVDWSNHLLCPKLSLVPCVVFLCVPLRAGCIHVPGPGPGAGSGPGV